MMQRPKPYLVHSVGVDHNGDIYGYAETQNEYVYYFVPKDGGAVEFDERYFKHKYRNFAHFRKIVRRFDDTSIWFRRPVECSMLTYDDLLWFCPDQVQRCAITDE